MSDGPYRTLNMRQQWKQLLKRAYQHAFDSQDVIDVICPALERDCAWEITSDFLTALWDYCTDKNATKALREYAIAGTLHLDHLAGLRGSVLHTQAIKRHAHQLARSQGLSFEKAEANLDQLLSKHEAEWRSFVHSLGNKSFIRNWVASAA
jgi:hypothetical protein